MKLGNQSPDVALIINGVRKAIYNALFNYWNDPAMAMLLATILDPRCKKAHGWPNELRIKVKVELKNQYERLKSTNNTQSQENPTITRPLIDCFQMHIFGPQEQKMMMNLTYISIILPKSLVILTLSNGGKIIRKHFLYYLN